MATNYFSQKLPYCLIVITMTLLLSTGAAFSQTAITPPGAGTETSPYLISELGHLVWMSDNATSSSGKYYSMTANIDASATATWNDAGTDTSILEGFMPIGTPSSPDTTSFRGIFNGDGHTITGLVINRPTTSCVGLFGCIGSGSKVQNLGLVGGSSMGRYYVGSLVGYNSYGTVLIAYSSGTVAGLSGVGGLIGYDSHGTVSNAYASGAVTSNSAGYDGGLIGYDDWGSISNTYATGAVKSFSYTGGLIGGSSSMMPVWSSYWDTETCKQWSSKGGVGKRTFQMKQKATFIDWDFINVWAIEEDASYPYLQSLPPSYKIDVSVVGMGHVTLSPEPVDGVYAPGTPVTLTAVPDSAPGTVGCRWRGTTSSENFTATILMDGDKNVVAEFLPVITIDSVNTLQKIGNDPAYPLDGVYYTMTNDIDASETVSWNDAGTDTSVLEGFKPIGTLSSPDTTSFRGIFDGGGHTIKGLIINRSNMSYVGLFGRIGLSGEVRNLGLIGGSVIDGNREVGGLVGDNLGTLTKAYTTCSVTGRSYNVGGLVGINSGTVSNAYATGTVTGSTSSGGLVGVNQGMMSNAYATGTVTGSTNSGGLVGINQGMVSNAYATGLVIGENTPTGGLIGVKAPVTSVLVLNSYWNMETSESSNSSGGTGKTTAEMKQEATFAGWDFINTWIINENVTYPLLRSFLKSGDANSDNAVDVGDLGILAANYGQIDMTWFQGDFNEDGIVDVGDLGILAANYGYRMNATADFNADYAKAFGTTIAEEDNSTDVVEENNSVCSNMGLPLVAGLMLLRLTLIKLDE